MSETNQISSSYIGTDESGKGDYFGPLVVAAVLVTSETRDRLLDLDVKDSKRTTDKKAVRIAACIEAEFPCSVIPIGAEKYNELYSKIRNLNKLLAWAHARAIENLLDERDVGLAVTDQFGDPKFVENALMKKGREIKLVQEVRAEKYIGVAAASIVARARFLGYLDRYGSQYDLKFPKGAGANVDQAAAEFCRRYSRDDLGKVAKLHFKNTSKVERLLQVGL